MKKIMRWAKQFKTTKRATVMSLAFLSMSAGAFAKTNASSFSKDDLGTFSTVPELNEWRSMDLADAKIVTPKKVDKSYISAYKEEKLALIKELVLNNTEYDEHFENAALHTGIPAIYIKITAASESGRYKLDDKNRYVLDENGNKIPEFNLNAKSHTGPRGIAQFTRSTGRAAGLVINKNVDERLEADKSIMAMALYMAHNVHRAKGYLIGKGKQPGALQYYHGFMSGHLQYNTNGAAVYDMFNLPHKLDVSKVLNVKDENQKLVVKDDQDEFVVARLAEKEAMRQQDVESLDGLEKLQFDSIQQIRDAAFEQIAVMDNIVPLNKIMVDQVIQHDKIMPLTFKLDNGETPLKKSLRKLSEMRLQKLEITAPKVENSIFAKYMSNDEQPLQQLEHPLMTAGVKQLFDTNGKDFSQRLQYNFIAADRKSPLMQEFTL